MGGVRSVTNQTDNKRTGDAMIREMNETHVPYGMLAIWFLGQESVVIKGGNTIIYIDPYLAAQKSRVFQAPFRPEDVTNATYCLITHEHSDHLDPSTLGVLARNGGTVFMAPGFCRGQMLDLGVQSERLLDAVTGQWREGDGVRIKPVPAAHEELDYEPSRDHRFVGYLLELNGVTLYHAGDTVIYPGLIDSLKAERIDLGMLPINGRDAFRGAKGLIGNMNYREAAELAVAAEMETVIPLHYDMFAGNSEKPGYFVDYLYEHYPEQKCHVLARFERFVYVSAAALTKKEQ
ncbi:MBL fold metallo-hydrolase [Paenibacillus piri]|uniref:MBL fold metallo-hydrolase n=1 Tax=Paenibacillus piri TaxID=2547395 RepID=A0A4R5KUX9_9BACL|nr:MBL fold metallo-hydrolase [Paenibacillus piri]TDF98767.1 MBL fold metallo-hydrolase [Paenibacillus piri]